MQQFPMDLCLKTLDMTSSRGFTRTNNKKEVILRKPNEDDKIKGKLDKDFALNDNISIYAQCRIKRQWRTIWKKEDKPNEEPYR